MKSLEELERTKGWVYLLANGCSSGFPILLRWNEQPLLFSRFAEEEGTPDLRLEGEVQPSGWAFVIGRKPEALEEEVIGIFVPEDAPPKKFLEEIKSTFGPKMKLFHR